MNSSIVKDREREREREREKERSALQRREFSACKALYICAR